MNLFFLSKNLKRSAKYHGDRHVVKMPLEAVQILYSVWFLLHPESKWRESAPWNKKKTMRGFKPTHLNHRLVQWVRESLANYRYCCKYARALCKEYKRRYNKTHAVEEHARWLGSNIPPGIQDRSMTPIPLCDGTNVKVSSIREAVTAYRKYYIATKSHLANYKNGRRPKWISNAFETREKHANHD